MLAKLTLIYDRKCQATNNRPSVVELKITADKVRKYISTGVKLLPKEWSNGSVVGRKDWKELNKRLHVIYKKCSEVVTKMMDENNFDLNAIPNLLKASMVQQETFIEYARAQAKHRYKKLTAGTIYTYDLRTSSLISPSFTSIFGWTLIQYRLSPLNGSLTA